MIDWDALIEPTRVHGSLYTDPAVFAAEVEHIWNRTWVFVGHVSEVPDPGDFVLKPLGTQQVIMVRDRDGVVRLLQNRCPHRANQVCDLPSGTTTTFRCPYHGWTFSNTGALLGYPFSTGYGGRERKADLGLAEVPRVDEIHGFVFGSLAADGPTLREHLGNATEVFDRLVRLSPSGTVALTAGWLQHRVRANWKMIVENETDGYHPQFVHQSIFGVAESGIGALYGERSTAVSRDLGGGHTEDDLRPELRRLDQPLGWFGTSPERVPDYVAQLHAAHGDAAREILVDGSPHVMIFPNLFLAEIQVFGIQPVAVDESIQHVTALQFPGCDDLNRRMLQQTIGSVGPAGFLLADDSEMYERNQRGVQVRDPEWLVIERGTFRERIDEREMTIADVTDELPQRAIWRHYRSLMPA